MSREVRRRRGYAAAQDLLSCGIRSTGVLDFNRLQTALNEVIRRHAAFTTTISPNLHLPTAEWNNQLLEFARTGVFSSGIYVQYESSTDPIAIRRVDMRSVSVERQDEQIRQLLQCEHDKPFDYARPPFARAVLVTLSSDDHLLIVVVDHLISDEWSLQIICREITSLYECGGVADSHLPMPMTSYSEHAKWEQLMIASNGFAGEKDFWERRWQEFAVDRIAFQQLPFYSPQPNNHSAKCARVCMRLGAEFGDALRRAASEQGTTVFVMLWVAYVIVLSHYTGRSRLAIWTHLANRSRRDVRDTVGFFVNTHLIGLDMSDDPCVDALLSRAQMHVLESLLHERMPLQFLWNATGGPPRLNDASLLVDYLSLMPNRRRERTIHSSSIGRVELPNVSVPRWSSLGLYGVERPSGLTLTIQYSVSRFSNTMAGQLIIDVHQVLTSLIAEPSRCVSSFRTLVHPYPHTARSAAS